MKITITVKPGAHKNTVTKINETHYTITLRAKPVQGKANESLKKILARHFDVSASCVSIKSGLSSRKKIIEIII